MRKRSLQRQMKLKKMKKLSKRVKIVLLVVAILAVCVTVGVIVGLNYHKIFVMSERLGWFKAPIELRKTEVAELREYSLSELYEDTRVEIDQSLMLVNKDNKLDKDFIPDISEYKDTGVYMSRPMIDAYASLSAAVIEKTGKKLYVSSDLRSAEEQEALYLADPNTATEVGASEHQTGLALDVYVAYYSGDGFIKSQSGRFVNANAHKYGFIMRYPSYGEEITGIRFEPWHIRYVGAPHAEIIYNNHLTLEEYIEGLEVGVWYEAEGYLISRQKENGGKLCLPQEFESCVISPDNMGCYIVTVVK